MILDSGIHCVLALHAGALGDFVLAHHLLARLRSHSPASRIEVVARSPFSHWAAGRGIIDRAHDYEQFGIDRVFAGADRCSPAPIVEALSAHDLVLNLLSADTGPAADGLRRLGARKLISVDPAATEETCLAGRHITVQWMRDLAAGGLDLETSDPARMRIDDPERAAARARLEDRCGRGGRALVVVHPGSGGRAKCAPLDALERIVETLKNTGCRVAWMVGPTELDWNGPAWMDRLRASAPVLYEEDVGRAADWLLGADRYIGHDAGMTHVAAALGLEVVALFGPTDPRVWRPLGERVRVSTFDAGPSGNRDLAGIEIPCPTSR